MRLNLELSDEQVAQLNEYYSDILVKETIYKSTALPRKKGYHTENLPRLVFHFNQRNLGRLYQMINQINRSSPCFPVEYHPEWK